MIEISVETIRQIAVIRLSGEIDATSAVAVQQKVLPLSVPGCKIILDLTKTAYVSSAGLRMLLSVYRQISRNQGRIVLVGLSEELKDTMTLTGFLDFFTVHNLLETGIQSFG